MAEDLIKLYDWAAWKFGPFEFRLCGYVVSPDQQMRCIITEPIAGVNIEEGFVETTNKLKFEPAEPIKKVDMIDMMYVLDRWMNLNVKGEPYDATDIVLESLGREKR